MMNAFAQGSYPSAPAHEIRYPDSVAVSSPLMYAIENPIIDRVNWWIVAAGFGAFLVSNLADYQVQAEAHGWRGLMWEANYRAPHWGILDFIPHDGYHVAMWLHNLGLIGGSLLTWQGLDGLPWYCKLPSVFLSYAIARYIGFSTPRKLMQGY
jgi:hypothetical protein